MPYVDQCPHPRIWRAVAATFTTGGLADQATPGLLASRQRAPGWTVFVLSPNGSFNKMWVQTMLQLHWT